MLAAALPLNGVTAWQMLHRLASTPGGGQALVLAAAGGVRSTLLQLCQADGVIAVGMASAGKHEQIRAAGALAVDRTQASAAAAVVMCVVSMSR